MASGPYMASYMVLKGPGALYVEPYWLNRGSHPVPIPTTETNKRPSCVSGTSKDDYYTMTRLFAHCFLGGFEVLSVFICWFWGFEVLSVLTF